jgi:hypothetical protein
MLRKLSPATVVLMLVAGCGATEGSLSGTVMIDGAKVPSGTVSFVSAGKVCQAEIRDGRYVVEGVPVGPAIVTVVRLDPNQPDPYDALNKVRKEMTERKVTDPKQIDPKVVTDAAELDSLAKKRYLLPLAYAAPQTSSLHFQVAAGVNTYDIELRGKKP